MNGNGMTGVSTRNVRGLTSDCTYTWLYISVSTGFYFVPMYNNFPQQLYP